MNNKRHHDLQLGIVLLVATLCVAFFTMAALSNFKLGLHFDKDMRIIAEVGDHQSMQDFTTFKQRQGHETDLVISQNDIAILNVSGVESSDAFIKEMLTEVPSAKILLMGSFGSMTKFLNNHSFISISLLIITMVITIYQISLHRMYGWYKALESIFMVMVPLFIITEMGYAFSINVWFAVLAVLLMQQLLGEYYEDNESIRWFFGFSLLILGVMIMVAHIERFYAVSYFLMVAGTFSMLLTVSYKYLFSPILTPYRLLNPQPNRRLLNPSTDGSYTKIKVLTVLILAMAMVSLLSMARGQYKDQSNDRGYYKELVVFQSKTTNYLEIQALLSRIGLFDEQISYLVSEQGQTWIEFSSATSVEDLKLAQSELIEEFNINSVYFDGVPPYNYYNTQTFNILIVSVIIAVATFYFVLFGLDKLWLFITEIILSTGFYALLMQVMDLHNNQVWLLGFLVLPIIYTLIAIDLKSNKSLADGIDSLIMSAVLMIMFALPIFVIVPSAVSAELIFYFLMILVAIYVAIALGSIVDRLKGVVIDDTVTTKK